MRRRWLALSLAIAAVVVVVLAVVVGAVALLRPGPIERRRAERAAEAEVVERAIAPLVTAWPGLQDEAKVRIKAAIELLTTASAPAEGGCEGLSGPLTVVHRWTLERLAADQREPWGGPTWLNSPAWNLLAGRTPLERTVEHYGRRDEVVRAALAGPCVGVLETDRRFGPEVSAQSFRSGNVDGVLRIVCVEDPRIACEAPIVSAPAERSFGAHLDADEAAALGVAASDAYWSAIAEAVAERGPGLGLVRGDR